jgi:hypothetical protein
MAYTLVFSTIFLDNLMYETMKSLRLLFQGSGRFFVLHEVPPDKKTPTEVSCLLLAEV